MSVDAAVFALGKRLLAEFEEVGLSREALPAVALHPGRIDAAGGEIARRRCCTRTAGD